MKIEINIDPTKLMQWHHYPETVPYDCTWNLFKIDEDPDIATPPAIVAFFEDNEIVGLRFFGLKEHQVTHWMPLPLPEEQECPS